MKVSCPDCQRPIPLEDVNVSTDLALCRTCAKQFSLAELAANQAGPEVDVTRPPRGAWFRQTGGGFEIGATTRSASALFLVPFTLLWSGGSLAGIYGSQLYKGQFDWKLCLFGLPFLLGSALLVPTALMTVFGKLCVRAEGDRGCVFAGIGTLGWTRRFRWSEITGVIKSQTRWQQNHRHLPLIELRRDSKPVRFGSQLSADRLDFMLGVLRRLLPRR